MRFLLPALLFGTLLSACYSSGTATAGTDMAQSTQNEVTSDQVRSALNLTDYLERVPGVQVIGRGGSAAVRVRGPQSFVAGQGPLFVLNGSILGYDYSTVYNAIDVREIKRVRVLKNASESARYGSRGATGVVEIFLRQY